MDQIKELILHNRFFFDANDGIPLKKLRIYIDKYGAKNILVGVDPGESDRPSDVAKPTLDFLKENNVPIHVYLVGPGMMSWSSQERNQIKKFAESVGIDTSVSTWHNKWINTGWKKKVLEQFSYYYNEYNAYSCEIDNLDGAVQEYDLNDYLIELKNSLIKNKIPTKLLLKNLSDEQLHNLLDQFKKNEIGLDFLCEYAIFEKGTGSPRNQLMVCEKMGIQAITPVNGLNDTYHYGVKQTGIQYECDESNLVKVA